MKSNSSWRIRAVQILLGVAIVVALVIVRGTNAGNPPVHVATDWSHRHLIYSKPKTLAEHIRFLSNPRYVQQLMRRNGRNNGIFGWDRWRKDANSLHGDWSVNLGTGATVEAGMYPAKFSFNEGTAYCDNAAQPDFVVYNTGLLTEQGGAANIIAFDNLYTGCPTTGGITVPNTYWAFNTASATGGGGIEAIAATSPVLSPDGSQVAFVQQADGLGAQLVVLTWYKGFGTIAAPISLSVTAPGAYHGCAAPCFTAVTFSGGTTHGDTTSSPFYDYTAGSDTLYVGDAVGTLHKFTGVFNGTPAEVLTNGWPLTVSVIGTALTSPVYDANSKKVYVTDANNYPTDHGGSLYSIDITQTPVTAVESLPVAYGNGFTDGPVVDPVAGMIYVNAPAAYEYPIPLGGPDPGGTGCVNAILQFPAGFTATTIPQEASIGYCNFDLNTYKGDFDNTYYTGAGNTGNMYVCGNTPGSSGNTPTLWQIPMTGTFGGTLHAGTQGPTFTTSITNTCGPVTEIYNPNAGPATDWIFTSMQGGNATAVAATCEGTTGSTGCVMSFNVTSGTLPAAATASVSAAGGASGIVVDNTVEAAPTGGSQVYFTPLANQPCTTSIPDSPAATGGCAIQASQAGLD